MQNIIVFLLLILTSVFSFLLDDKDLYVLFGFQLAIIAVHLTYLRYIFFLFSPLMLLIFYINISLFVGGWAFNSGYILSSYFIERYSEWNNMNMATFFLLTSISIIYYVDSLYRSSNKGFILQKKTLNKIPALYAFIFFIIALIVYKMPLNLDAFGASGGFNQIFLLTGFFIVVSALVSNSGSIPITIRVLVYVLLFYILIGISINSKREAIFAIFPIIFLEFYIRNIKYNLSNIFLIVFIAIFIMVVIGYMSILRGYGSFELNGGLQDLVLLSNYFYSDTFVSSFMDNMEFSFFYFNTYNSIELILNNPDLMTWGSTLIKPLFILIPRDMVTFKPDSMINIYTNMANPYFASVGGSWPINIISEFFWNFHFLSFVFILIFSIIVIRVYYSYLTSLTNMKGGMIAFSLLVYMVFIMLIRGSGFDLFLIYIICSFILVITVNSVFKLLKVQK